MSNCGFRFLSRGGAGFCSRTGDLHVCIRVERHGSKKWLPPEQAAEHACRCGARCPGVTADRGAVKVGAAQRRPEGFRRRSPAARARPGRRDRDRSSAVTPRRPRRITAPGSRAARAPRPGTPGAALRQRTGTSHGAPGARVPSTAAVTTEPRARPRTAPRTLQEAGEVLAQALERAAAARAGVARAREQVRLRLEEEQPTRSPCRDGHHTIGEVLKARCRACGEEYSPRGQARRAGGRWS